MEPLGRVGAIGDAPGSRRGSRGRGRAGGHVGATHSATRPPSRPARPWMGSRTLPPDDRLLCAPGSRPPSPDRGQGGPRELHRGRARCCGEAWGSRGAHGGSWASPQRALGLRGSPEPALPGRSPCPAPSPEPRTLRGLTMSARAAVRSGR